MKGERRGIRAIAAAWLVFALLASPGCDSGSKNPDAKVPMGRDYERILFNGYKVFRASASQISITDNSGSIVVGPSVVLYSHQYPIIFGEVRESEWAKISDIPGYFLIDGITGIIHKGLTEPEWEEALRLNRIAIPPRLRKP